MHHDNHGVPQPHGEDGLSSGRKRTSGIAWPDGEANTSLIESPSGGMMPQDDPQATSCRGFDASRHIQSYGDPNRQLTLRQAPSHAKAANGDYAPGEAT